MAFAKRVGDRVGPYALKKVLGEGGAGQVFAAAWDPDDEQRAEAPDDHPLEVAVKLLRASHATSEQLFHRFVREIDVAQRIHHPHLMQHYDSGLADDVLYYAMELAPSGSLRDVVAHRGALPWRDAAESAMHIADALGALHDNGVIHRDLKPDNVFLSSEGVLKLGDFGLAYNPEMRQLTVGGQTVGSVRYMAPEQVRARRDLDGRCDLYALGCVLFEMLTGRPPFTSTEPMEVFYHHAEIPPPRVRDLAPATPEPLCELVDLLLRKEKEERPPKAQTVRDALAEMITSGDGSLSSIDSMLEGAPAEIEPIPFEVDEEDDESSLAGTDRYSGNELNGADYTDELDGLEGFDDETKSHRPLPSEAPRGNLAHRLTRGSTSPTTTPSSKGKRTFGIVVLMLILAAVAVIISSLSGNENDSSGVEVEAMNKVP